YVNTAIAALMAQRAAHLRASRWRMAGPMPVDLRAWISLPLVSLTNSELGHNGMALPVGRTVGPDVTPVTGRSHIAKWLSAVSPAVMLPCSSMVGVPSG